MTVRQQKARGKVRLEFEAIKTGRKVLDTAIEKETTVKSLLNGLAKTHPKLAEMGFDVKSQQLNGVMAVIVNGTLIQSLNGLETRLKDGDVISFVPLIDGG